MVSIVGGAMSKKCNIPTKNKKPLDKVRYLTIILLYECYIISNI